MDAATVATAYGLTEQDKKNLAHAILLAYLAAQHAAYTRAAKSAGVTSAWAPDTGDAQELALEDVESIAQTYDDDLQHAIELFLMAWFLAHGSYEGVEPHLATMLTAWCSARAGWKSEQISRATVGRGLSAGTSAFVHAFLNGEIADTSGMGTDGLYIAVVPGTSSNDVCASYAGYVWPIDEYPGLGQFPMHVNCVHSEIVLRR